VDVADAVGLDYELIWVIIQVDGVFGASSLKVANMDEACCQRGNEIKGYIFNSCMP
jgi:hypothetical protein